MSRRDHRPGRPPGFSYRKVIGGKLRSSAVAVLHCDGISVEGLARRFGTPLYVYSASSIRRRAKEFSRAFGVRHTICYSVKANFNLSILRLLAKAGCGFDVVSGGELERVLRVGPKGCLESRIFRCGQNPGRDAGGAQGRHSALQPGKRARAEFRLPNAPPGNGKPARIAFRVNPDVPADTHPYISTGLRQHKFGVPIREARKLYATAARHKHLEVAGISVHIGSQITELASFAAAMERVAELVKQAAGRWPSDRIRRCRRRLRHSDYRRCKPSQVLRICRRLCRGGTAPAARFEGPAAAGAGPRYRGTCGRASDTSALQENERPQGISGGGRGHERSAAAIALWRLSSDRSGATGSRPARYGTVDIVGPDLRDRRLFRPRPRDASGSEGDLLAVLDAGAYGMALASNYNTRRRPAEVLVDGKISEAHPAARDHGRSAAAGAAAALILAQSWLLKRSRLRELAPPDSRGRLSPRELRITCRSYQKIYAILPTARLESDRDARPENPASDLASDLPDPSDFPLDTNEPVW